MKNCLLCLLSIAFLAVSVRSACTGAPKTGCDAFNVLDIDQGPTVCTGSPSVNCQVVKDARQTIADAYEQLLDDGFCDVSTLKQVSKTIAGAFAGVLTNGLEKVTCEGKGLFCGYEVKDKAWALSLQELFTDLANEADIEGFTDEFCYGDLRSVSESIQSAVTGASAICTQGGNAADYSASVVDTVAPAIENALGRARARACGDRRLRRTTWCSRQGGRAAPGGPAKAGDPCGSMGFSKECVGAGLEMCCSKKFRTTICPCRGCNGPWIRMSNRRDAVQKFADGDGVLCTCPQAGRFSLRRRGRKFRKRN